MCESSKEVEIKCFLFSQKDQGGVDSPGPWLQLDCQHSSCTVPTFGQL